MLDTAPTVFELAEILLDYSEILILLFFSSGEQDPAIQERLQVIHQLSTSIITAVALAKSDTAPEERSTVVVPVGCSFEDSSSLYSSSVTTVRPYEGRNEQLQTLSKDTYEPIYELSAVGEETDRMSFKARGSRSDKPIRLLGIEVETEKTVEAARPKTWAEIEIEKAKERRQRDLEWEKEKKREEKARRRLERRFIARERARKMLEPKPVFKEPVYDGSTLVGSTDSNSRSSRFANLFRSSEEGAPVNRPPEFSPNISPRTTMPLQRSNSDPAASVQTRRGLPQLTLKAPPAGFSVTTQNTPGGITSPTKALLSFFTSSNGDSDSPSGGKNIRRSQLSAAGRKLRSAISSLGGKNKSTPSSSSVTPNDSPTSTQTSSTADVLLRQANADEGPFLGSGVLRPKSEVSGPPTNRKTSSLPSMASHRQSPPDYNQLAPSAAIELDTQRRISGPTAPTTLPTNFDVDMEAQRELDGFRDRNRGSFTPNFKRRPSAPRPSFDESAIAWNQHPGTPWEKDYGYPPGIALAGPYDVDEGPFPGRRLVKSQSHRDTRSERWRR